MLSSGTKADLGKTNRLGKKDRHIVEQHGITVFETTPQLNGKQFFYCPHCECDHFHGEGYGHRSAHCSKPNSPYAQSGYWLVCNHSIAQLAEMEKHDGRYAVLSAVELFDAVEQLKLIALERARAEHADDGWDDEYDPSSEDDRTRIQKFLNWDDESNTIGLEHHNEHDEAIVVGGAVVTIPLDGFYLHIAGLTEVYGPLGNTPEDVSTRMEPEDLEDSGRDDDSVELSTRP